MAPLQKHQAILKNSSKNSVKKNLCLKNDGDDSMTSNVILPYTIIEEDPAPEYVLPEPFAVNIDDVQNEPGYVSETNQGDTIHTQQKLVKQIAEQEKEEATYTQQLQTVTDQFVISIFPEPATVPIVQYTPYPTLADITVRSKDKVPCDICHKSFVNRSKMLWHRRTHDKHRVRFQCPYNDCDRQYASKQACDLHYRQTHLESGFICPVCQKLFVIRQTLEVHMRYHTGTFPFECECCDKKFAQKGHLTTHMHVNHNNLRYICPASGCGKVFKNTMSLRNHSYVHVGMPFRCAFCDKGYPQKSKLKAHISFKHNQELSLDDLESMRKFKDSRTRHSFVRLEVEEDGVELAESVIEFDDNMNREIEVAL